MPVQASVIKTYVKRHRACAARLCSTHSMMRSTIQVPNPDLASLDTDVLLHILSLLGPTHLLQLSSTCKQLCTISRHPKLWQLLCHAKWYHPSPITQTHHSPARGTHNDTHNPSQPSSSDGNRVSGWLQLYATSNGLLSNQLQLEELQWQRHSPAESSCIAVYADSGSMQVAVGQGGCVQLCSLAPAAVGLSGTAVGPAQEMAAAATAAAAATVTGPTSLSSAAAAAAATVTDVGNFGAADRAGSKAAPSASAWQPTAHQTLMLPDKQYATATAWLAGHHLDRPNRDHPTHLSYPSQSSPHHPIYSSHPHNNKHHNDHRINNPGNYSDHHSKHLSGSNDHHSGQLPQQQLQISPQMLLVGTAQGSLHTYTPQPQPQQAGCSATHSKAGSERFTRQFSYTVHPQRSNLPVADILHLHTGSNHISRHDVMSRQHGPMQHGATVSTQHGPTQHEATEVQDWGQGCDREAVAVLHDSYWRCMVWQDAAIVHSHQNHVRLYSGDLQHCLGEVHDIMDGWQFVCMAALAAPPVSSQTSMIAAGATSPPPGGSTERLAACGELVLGSVAGPPCARCWQECELWLCYHKQPARTAALCIVDWRVTHGLSARFSLHHRSMYPHLAVIHRPGSSSGSASQWVATSHAHSPLCVWDLRKMSSPLFEQGPLNNWTQGPLGGATYPAEHQGLWLTATEDSLVGRAANGCLWAWDLADLLGWADASTMGRWQALEQVPTWMNSTEALGNSKWPRCIGALAPGLAGIPITQLLPQDATSCVGPAMVAISSMSTWQQPSCEDLLPSTQHTVGGRRECQPHSRQEDQVYTGSSSDSITDSESAAAAGCSHAASGDAGCMPVNRHAADGISTKAQGGQCLAAVRSASVNHRHWVTAHNEESNPGATSSWLLGSTTAQICQDHACIRCDEKHAAQQSGAVGTHVGRAAQRPGTGLRCAQGVRCQSSQPIEQRWCKSVHEPELDDDRIDTLAVVCLSTGYGTHDLHSVHSTCGG